MKVKKILTANVDFSYNYHWNKIADHIGKYDKKWHTRKLFGKVYKLFIIGKKYDVIVFNYDVRLAFLCALFLRIFCFKKNAIKIVFITLLIDVSIFNKKSFLHFIFYYIFVRLQHKIIVHTKEEITIYRKTFKIIPKNKFIYIPYFYYQDNSIITTNRNKKKYILCAGNHRDIGTFVNAMSYLKNYNGVVIAGEGDRLIWENNNEVNIDFFFNLSYKKYKQYIADAMALVVPINNTKLKRSLGIIATFQAVSLDIPVIAADTFHLQDYFSKNDINYYKSEDSTCLADTINQVVKNYKASKNKVKVAKIKLYQYYTIDNFITALTHVC
ncbi:hypothetical protein HN415_00585 [Candidatus Woesearchaeota archaeon]|nr:hypothetical protein [Candidatus Woesearchaeota archaeon]